MIGLTPELTTVAAVEHDVLRLTFADGTTGAVAVLDRMRGPAFTQARTSQGFVQAFLDVEAGAVSWPGGADLAPDTLYVRLRSGPWPRQGAVADTVSR